MNIRMPFAYLFVSACCFIGNNVIMIVADALNAPLWLAVLLSFTLVVIIGYTLHSLLTFKSRFSFLAFIRYAVSMSVNIPFAYVITWFWYSWLDFTMLVAAPFASVCMLVLNFLLSRWAIIGARQKKVTNL